MMVSRDTLAALLRERRIRAGLTRPSVARQCGLPAAAIRDLEKGERRLTPALLGALRGVQALDLPPLMEGGGECPADRPLPQGPLPPPPPLCLTAARYPAWLAAAPWLPRPSAEARCLAAPAGCCFSAETRGAVLDALADQLVGFSLKEVTEALYRAAARQTESYNQVAQLLGVSRRSVYGHLPARQPKPCVALAPAWAAWTKETP